MGLLDSILAAASGKTGATGEANPLMGIISGLLAQSGGLQGLASKFSQSGQGNAFQSWVGMGENQPVSSNQIQNALGSEQLSAMASRMGVDPAMASNFLAEYLPKIVDKLTPAGKSILLQTISRGWRHYCLRYCRALVVNLRPTNPPGHSAGNLRHLM